MRRARVRHFVYMEIILDGQMDPITSPEISNFFYATALTEVDTLPPPDA